MLQPLKTWVWSAILVMASWLPRAAAAPSGLGASLTWLGAGLEQYTIFAASAEPAPSRSPTPLAVQKVLPANDATGRWRRWSHRR